MNLNINYVSIFNQIVDEFFNELMEIFPEENKIKVQYSLFQTISKINSKKVCNEFMIKSIPFLEKIAMRDDEFFIGNDIPFLKALNIQNIWTPELSEGTKKAIWRYIQSFFTIGVNITEMPLESYYIIKYIINYQN